MRFGHVGDVAQCDANGLALPRRESVLVEADHGPTTGTVLLEPAPCDTTQTLPKILRVLSAADREILQRNKVREREAFAFCRERIHATGLPMKLIAVDLGYTGSRAIFYFTADDRIDFRSLVRDLAQRFHTRIEMRQMGVRDAARLTGGTGICGAELCCSTWLPQFEPVSIRMAKDQDLALNQDKLSGLCGRLRCCLRYEQETYVEARKGMPHIGKPVVTPQGHGRVRDVDVLRRIVRVELGDGQTLGFPAEEVAAAPTPEQQQRPPHR